jgi:hypothetical protein
MIREDTPHDDSKIVAGSVYVKKNVPHLASYMSEAHERERMQ